MFYRFSQNNSGGYYEYDLDNGITEVVYIEADLAEFALQKAQEIGIYFNGVERDLDCECCGDRWNNFADEIKNINEVKKCISKGRNISSIIFKDDKIEIFDKMMKISETSDIDWES